MRLQVALRELRSYGVVCSQSQGLNAARRARAESLEVKLFAPVKLQAFQLRNGEFRRPFQFNVALTSITVLYAAPRFSVILQPTSSTLIGQDRDLTAPALVQVTAAQSPSDETVQPKAFPQDAFAVSAQTDAANSKCLHQDFSYDVARHTE